MKRSGRKSLAQTPAPKSERIFGSKVNKVGSASSEESAKSIVVSDKVLKVLENKQREYNAENKDTKVSIDTLKAVFRRGAGAYSTSHRPTITGGKPNSRTAWGIARVNKFLEKRSGKQVKKAYVQDDDLLKKYHLGGDMSKHLAPNGKPSNLTHEQWHLVRTPEFKAWFGDWENSPEIASKVVDENGEPLVVYHGTNTKFTSFKLGGSGYSSFTENKKLAESYGSNVDAFFLQINNLYIIDGNGEYIWNFIGEKDSPDSFFRDSVSFSYDGIMFKNVIDFNGRLGSKYVLDVSDVYMVRKNTQIKLADGTNTIFDSSNPDIRYAKGGKVTINPTEIECHNCHWKWKVKDGGEDLFICHKCHTDNSKYYQFEGLKGEKILETISYAKGGIIEVVLNEGNGVTINKLYSEWSAIRTQKQQEAWQKKVRNAKFGTYGTIGLLETLEKFNFMESNKINGVAKHDFIDEVKDALNSYAEGGTTPKFGAVENTPYKGWSEEKVMSYDFPELYEIAEYHKIGYKTIRNEFIKGIFVEREHTSDWGMSAHVSMQHIFENPRYYTILQSLGL